MVSSLIALDKALFHQKVSIFFLFLDKNICCGYSLEAPWRGASLFVCVEVLRPSQPNGVMSSAVSLPNHTFTGQA